MEGGGGGARGWMLGLEGRGSKGRGSGWERG